MDIREIVLVLFQFNQFIYRCICMFKCIDKYKLFLSWDVIKYVDDTTAVLYGASFSGPALKIAGKIQDNDSIVLDVTSQNVVVLDSWDMVNLSWNKVIKQTAQEAKLDSATLVSNNLVRIRLLNNNDKILINTEKHEDKVHIFNLVYAAVVVKSDAEQYDYSKK